jgi:hypothetical protein
MMKKWMEMSGKVKLTVKPMMAVMAASNPVASTVGSDGGVDWREGGRRGSVARLAARGKGVWGNFSPGSNRCLIAMLRLGQHHTTEGEEGGSGALART